MPNPKLETYKNKATNTVYDYTDADAQSQLSAIKDGTTIDSFGDVETALSTKYDINDESQISILDYDYVPYYADAESATRKIYWTNIKNGLKSFFDDLYCAIGLVPSGASSSNKLATASDVTGLQGNIIANTKLIKDTVGWVNKQLITYPYSVNGTAIIATVNITPSNGKFTLNGTSNEAISMPFHYRQGAGTDNNPIILPAGKYKFIKTSNKVGFLVVRTVGGSGDIFVTVGNSDTVKEFTLSETTQIGLTLTADNGTAFSNEVVEFMICDADILDNTVEPYRNTTAVALDTLKEVTANAADFAAFKTAIGNL